MCGLPFLKKKKFEVVNQSLECSTKERTPTGAAALARGLLELWQRGRRHGLTHLPPLLSVT